ncbi:hypothetical protein EI555_000155, partial [Monodon monoceros]
CGVPAIRPVLSFSQRIVNGENAVLGSWPWQVSLQDSNSFHFCSGSLISQSWVVTAAHCNVVPLSCHSALLVAAQPHSHCSPGCHFVILGEYDLSSSAEPLQVLSILRAITHPFWNPTTMNNDLMLLKLASPAQYTTHISPVCLASSNEVLPEGLTCHHWLRPPQQCGAGRGQVIWDLTTHSRPTGSVTPARLQQVILPLVTVSQWPAILGLTHHQFYDLCRGLGASSCQGECGGPLVCQKGDMWVLTGIVSWGANNCNMRAPATYTQVSKFSTWINHSLQPSPPQALSPSQSNKDPRLCPLVGSLQTEIQRGPEWKGNAVKRSRDRLD